MNTANKTDPHRTPVSRRSKTAKKERNEWSDVLLFYVLPFLVFNGLLLVLVASKPHITIQVANTKDYRTTTAKITVQSLLPIKEFASAQEGTPLLLTETKKGEYTADISRNGVIEIYARGMNGMMTTEYEHVNILDDVAPLIGEQYSIQEGILTLTLEDSQSGLDYQSVFAITASGVTLLPLSSDKQTGLFTFPMQEDLLIICASDLAGNGMQATFSTHTEVISPEGIPVAQYPPDAAQAASSDIPTQTGLPAQADTQQAQTELSAQADTQQAQTGLPAQADTQAQATAQTPTAQAELPTQAAASSAMPSTAADDSIIIHINTQEP